MGPHGAGIPMILVAVIGFITSLKVFTIDLINTFFYSLFIIIGYVTILIVRLDKKEVYNPLIILLAVIFINIGLTWILIDMSEIVRSIPLYSSIPFWITSLLVIIFSIKKFLKINFTKVPSGNVIDR
jgi:hypothetical protein